MPTAEAPELALGADELVAVRLFRDVCIDGQDLGPSFGTPVAQVPERWARTLIRRETAREAFLGPCSRDTRRCDTATSPAVETARCCIDGAVETLRVIQELFQTYGVGWWADYGTALGVATGGKFFWNDKDCDIGVMRSDLETVLRLQGAFEERGFTFDYQAPRDGMFAGGDRVKIRWSETNLVNTDIFFWEDRGGTLRRLNYVHVDRFKGREFPAAWVTPTVLRPFEALKIPCPNRLEALVEHRYGSGWRDLPPALHGPVQR